MGFLSFLVLMVTTVTACGGGFDLGIGVRGSGAVISETREVTGFDGVVLLGSGDVTIEVTGTDSLTIEAEDNILPLLTTQLSGRTLELGTKSSISPTKPITYSITVASLESVGIPGSGTITARQIDTESFRVEISGSGTVDASGAAQALAVDISGSGAYLGEDLAARIGEVSISGSGSAVVNPTDELDVRISGSGSVQYFGDPSVTQSVTGSGSISHG